MVLFVASCSVETTTTAATVSATKAREAKQAQNTKEQIQNKINAAMNGAKLSLFSPL
jgi:hypothetical protein